MKIIAVGSFQFEDEEALADLRGKPLVVLTGTFDEVREAGALLYQDVQVAASHPQSEDKGESNA